MIVKQSFRFEAAHRLPHHGGKCAHAHGHSYRFTVSLEHPVDPRTGMVIDFGAIESVVQQQVLNVWDHRDMNAFLENPTAENMVVDLWSKLEAKLPGLAEIELFETPDSSVVYRGKSGAR